MAAQCRAQFPSATGLHLPPLGTALSGSRARQKPKEAMIHFAITKESSTT